MARKWHIEHANCIDEWTLEELREWSESHCNMDDYYINPYGDVICVDKNGKSYRPQNMYDMVVVWDVALDA